MKATEAGISFFDTFRNESHGLWGFHHEKSNFFSDFRYLNVKRIHCKRDSVYSFGANEFQTKPLVSGSSTFFVF